MMIESAIRIEVVFLRARFAYVCVCAELESNANINTTHADEACKYSIHYLLTLGDPACEKYTVQLIYKGTFYDSSC